MARLALTVITLLHFANYVVAQDQAGRLDILVGSDNTSACQLGHSIHEKCGTRAPGLDKTPIPSICTCNNVFFNIWSACSYASGNNTLPIYSQWLKTCESSSVDTLKSSLATKDNDAIGITIPNWARLAVPGNSSFDVQQAVVLVHLGSKPWSVLQIVLPCAAALVAAVLTAVCLVLRKRKNVKRSIKDYMYRLKPVPKVKPVDERQFNDWVIEQPLAASQADSFKPPHLSDAYHDDASSPNHHQRQSDSTIPGHPSLPSSGLLHSVEVFDGTTQNPSDAPGGRMWPDSVIPPDRTYPFSLFSPQHTSGSNSKPTTPAPSSRWRVRSVRMPKPWKPRPVQILEKRPGKGFRVDGSTDESFSVGQRSSRGHGDDPENIRSSFEIHRHEADVDDFYDEPATMGDEHSEDEATNLMTDDQRTSYFETNGSAENSRSSRNIGTVNSSSIDSHVRVIPPSTTSSESNRNTMVSRPPSSRYLPRPIVPPPPKQPAPEPPSIPARLPLRTMNLMSMTSTPQNIQPPQTIYSQPSNLARQMTPIQEIDIRSPSPSLSSMSAITRRPSGGEVRPLPMPNSPPHGQLSFAAGASVSGLSKSASASSSSVYEDHSRDSSSVIHLRKNSGDSVRSARPLPLPTPIRGRNPSLPSLPNTLHSSPTGREDTANDYFSVGRGEASEMGSPRYSPHRGLSSDDDASFYMTSPVPTRQHHLLPSPPLGPPRRARSPMGSVGTPSEDERPTAELFPASVRGAGYRGSPGP